MACLPPCPKSRKSKSSKPLKSKYSPKSWKSNFPKMIKMDWEKRKRPELSRSHWRIRASQYLKCKSRAQWRTRNKTELVWSECIPCRFFKVKKRMGKRHFIKTFRLSPWLLNCMIQKPVPRRDS
jgi:hypothetical protein